MVTSELREKIVWITVKDELTAQEVTRIVGRWLLQKDSFHGFITDLCEMKPIPSTTEQKKLEEWRQRNNSGKPHALLGQTNALGVLIKLYVRLTKAKDTRYFMNPRAAVDWVKSFDQR